MNTFVKFSQVILLCLAITACSSHRKIDPENVASRELPSDVSEADLGSDYLWGGKILSTDVKETETVLTVLSYPLKSSEVPLTSETSGGRFIATYDGFLEPSDYKIGSQVTLLGRLDGFKEAKVSEANYKFPMIKITDIALLKEKEHGTFGLPVSLGIGVGFGF